MSELINVDKLRDLFGKIEYNRLHEYNLLKGKVSECGIECLLTNPYNRDIDKTKVERIKQDINRSGKIYPIVYSEVDNNGEKSKMVVDGHHRLQALRDMGHTKVPVVQSDSRGTETKAPKQILKGRFSPPHRSGSPERYRRVNRFGIGDKILFYNNREGAWDSGQVSTQRTGNTYQVYGDDGNSRLIDGRNLRRDE